MSLLAPAHEQLQLNSRLQHFAVAKQAGSQQAFAAHTVCIASLNKSAATQGPLHWKHYGLSIDSKSCAVANMLSP